MMTTPTTKDGTPVDLEHYIPEMGIWKGKLLIDSDWIGPITWTPDGKCCGLFKNKDDWDLTEPPGRGEEESNE